MNWQTFPSSYRSKAKSLAPGIRKPRFAIVASLGFLRRSIGTGSLSDPQNSQKDPRRP